MLKTDPVDSLVWVYFHALESAERYGAASPIDRFPARMISLATESVMAREAIFSESLSFGTWV